MISTGKSTVNGKAFFFSILMFTFRLYRKLWTKTQLLTVKAAVLVLFYHYSIKLLTIIFTVKFWQTQLPKILTICIL